jgi:hypothetical protein
MEIVILIFKFVVFVGLFMGGFLLVRKFVDHKIMELHNEVAGFIYAVLGVIYAVLLGFVVITVWEDYKDAERYLNEESSHAINLYRNASSFPDSVKVKIQDAVVVYLNDMVDHEFAAMDNFHISDEAISSYLNIWKVHQNYMPANPYQDIWYAETLKELNLLAESRRLRINSIYYDVHTFMWVVLFFGAFIIIGFSYLFGTKNTMAHLIMVFSLASTICLILVLIAALVHPYTGLIHLNPEPFILALKQLR